MRRRKQKAELDPEFYSLERQGWFHGKITADYAERPLRKNGDFLVREEPATPGTYVLVLRHQGSTLVVPIVKGRSKSSKSSRIKYRIDGLDVTYESVTELITYYWHEKKTISKNAQILIIRPISRDTTLLSVDDKPKPKRLELEKLFEPDNNEIPDGVRTLEHGKRRWMKRQESEPVISPSLNKADASFNLDIEVHVNSNEDETKSTRDKNVEKKESRNTLEKNKEVSSSFQEDKKDDCSNNNNNNTEIKPLSGNINSSVHSTDSLKSRSWSNMDRSEEKKSLEDASSAPSLVHSTNTLGNDTGVYSTPRPSTDQLSDLGDKKTFDDGYYSSPKSLENGERSSGEAALNDADYDIPNSRPVSGDSDLDITSSLSFHRESEKKRGVYDNFYDRPVVSAQSSFCEADMDYAVPSSRPADDHCAVFSEESTNTYDIPPLSLNSKLDITTAPRKTSKSETKSNPTSRKNSESEQQKKDDCISEDQKTKSPTAVAPKRKDEIYQEVVRKFHEALVCPFLKYDTNTLARHLTRADINVVWYRDLYKTADAWNSQDGSGGALGLELIMLPQGRERRAAVLNRWELNDILAKEQIVYFSSRIFKAKVINDIVYNVHHGHSAFISEWTKINKIRVSSLQSHYEGTK